MSFSGCSDAAISDYEVNVLTANLQHGVSISRVARLVGVVVWDKGVLGIVEEGGTPLSVEGRVAAGWSDLPALNHHHHVVFPLGRVLVERSLVRMLEHVSLDWRIESFLLGA
jgi:hypothetical protein